MLIICEGGKTEKGTLINKFYCRNSWENIKTEPSKKVNEGQIKKIVNRVGLSGI